MSCFSSDSTTENLPKVVILGGGVSGSKVAMGLMKKANVTLIDPKNYMEIRHGGCRAAVQGGDKGKKLVATFDSYLPGVNIIQDYTASVQPSSQPGTPGTVTLASGRQVPFDYLVIAVGGKYSDPYFAGLAQGMDQRIQQYNEMQAKIKAAKTITIVGGGTVGVELAGEIADEFKDKKVTIVHPKTYLMHQAPDERVGKAAQEFLEEKGVRVLLGQKAQFEGNKATVTTEGINVEADLTVNCVGFQPNVQFLEGGALASALDEQKKIRVNPTLQVVAGTQEVSNIFAMGDCNNFDCWKTGMQAFNQAEYLIKAIQTRFKGKTPNPYKAPKDVMLVSVGKDRGVMSKPGGGVSKGWFPVMIKSKRELAVPMGINFFRGMYKMPKMK